MSLHLGIDHGMTDTAVAKHHNGVAEMVELGHGRAAQASVVLVKEDGTIATGDEAKALALQAPTRVLRQFKARLGSSTPFVVDGRSHAPEQVLSYLIRDLYQAAVAKAGAAAEKVVFSHPATWGTFKVETLTEAAVLAGIAREVIATISEPEAAALAYDSQQPLTAGELVAVYDLGGGTFNAAVLRRTQSGFELLPGAAGIDRLGGDDFDDEIFQHVVRALQPEFSELDPDDEVTIRSVWDLRNQCNQAKEALSFNPEAVIDVQLPGIQRLVRITRAEFERAITTDILRTVDVLSQAISNAELEPTDISRILLVGGSCRIPLVNQLVHSELKRPVAVDQHPSHTIAIGASLVATGVSNPSSGATIIHELFRSTSPKDQIVQGGSTDSGARTDSSAHEPVPWFDFGSEPAASGTAPAGSSPSDPMTSGPVISPTIIVDFGSASKPSGQSAGGPNPVNAWWPSGGGTQEPPSVAETPSLQPTPPVAPPSLSSFPPPNPAVGVPSPLPDHPTPAANPGYGPPPSGQMPSVPADHLATSRQTPSGTQMYPSGQPPVSTLSGGQSHHESPKNLGSLQKAALIAAVIVGLILLVLLASSLNGGG